MTDGWKSKLTQGAAPHRASQKPKLTTEYTEALRATQRKQKS